MAGEPGSASQDASILPDASGSPPDAAFLRATLDGTAANIVFLDLQGRVLYATPAMLRGLGLEAGEIVGRTWDQIPALLPLLTSLEVSRKRAIRTGEAMSEILAFDLGNRHFESEFNTQPVTGAGGECIGTVVTAWDVGELRRAVRRVSELDRVYKILAETNQLIVRVHDPARLMSEACRIAVDLGGFSLAWIGEVQPDGDVRPIARAGGDAGFLDSLKISARDDEWGRGPVGEAIRADRPVAIGDSRTDPRMAPWRERLGAFGFLTAAAFPLRRDGKPFGALALYSPASGYFDDEEMRLFEELANDLSFALESIRTERDRLAAEEALRQSERLYRDLFERNPSPMWVYEVATLRVLAVNDAAIHNYGYSRDEFTGLTLHDIRPPEEVPFMLEQVARTSESGYRPRTRARHRRKDGTPIEVEVTGHDIEFDGRKARLILAADVTEQSRLEKHLSDATRLESIGQFAGGIAHDFNNLLTAVNGYADLLVAALGDDPLANDAREIRRAGGRAADLTRQVLAFARRQVLTPRPVDLNAVVTDVAQMLRRVIGENIRLSIVVDERPAVVMADGGQLEQVLVNLVVNARDAMPDGGVLEIAVRRVDDADELGDGSIIGPAFLLSVTDDGIGMDESTCAHAFEPFFTTKAAGAGTGLGLSMVYGIVSQSGGAVWAVSELGRGTTISVLLPCVDETPEPVAATPVRAPSSEANHTILVVEDEQVVRALVVSALERVGYRVLVAGTPQQAVALAEGTDEQIDLLLTDFLMPDINGRVLADRLKGARPSLRVILMSGYGANPAPDGSDRPVNFITKPFGLDELTGLVAKVLADN